MAIVINWKESEATGVGHETEVVAPIDGVGDIPGIWQRPFVDKLLQAGAKQGLYRTGTIEFDKGKLHIVGPSLDAARIKAAVDSAVPEAESYVKAHIEASEAALQRAREGAAERKRQVQETQDQFRAE